MTAMINMRGVLAAMLKMSNRSALLLVIISFGCLSSALAQFALTPLNATEIRSTLFGQLFTGEYPSGSQWAERFNTDGTSDYSENGMAIRGTMSLSGSKLCFTYPNTQTLNGGCFEIWKRGANCFDFYTPDGGATLDQRQFGRGWQARGWIADQPSTCLSEEIS